MPAALPRSGGQPFNALSRPTLLLLSALAVFAGDATAPPGDTVESRSRIADRIRGRNIAAAHPPMEAPTLRTAAGAGHMRDEDVVLGVVVEGEPRAYPWWVVKHFHVV